MEQKWILRIILLLIILQIALNVREKRTVQQVQTKEEIKNEIIEKLDSVRISSDTVINISEAIDILTPPDTICIDTATVKKWANDKIVIKNQVEYLTNELTESKAFEQRCKLENLSLVSELETFRRRKVRSIFFGALSGVVLGLLI